MEAESINCSRKTMKAFEAANLYFHRAADALDLADNVRTVLLTPEREVQVR